MKIIRWFRRLLTGDERSTKELLGLVSGYKQALTERREHEIRLERELTNECEQHQLDIKAWEEQKNNIYGERNRVVCLAAKLAMLHCMKVGIRWGVDADYPIVYIDLPNGQVSWHISRREFKFYCGFLPDYAGEWDGHDMPEKHKRIADFGATTFTVFNEAMGRRVRGQWRCHCGKLHTVNERFCTRCSKTQPTISVVEE